MGNKCCVIDFFKKIFKKKKCCSGACNLTIKKAKLNLTEEDVQQIQKLDERIVVGKILKIAKHPDSKITKVQVTQCNLGNGKTAQILCGGVNIKEGQIVPVATLGTKLTEDFEIGERSIRGEVSNGMICARSELNLSLAGEEKGQIWELPTEMKDLLGKSLKDILNT